MAPRDRGQVLGNHSIEEQLCDTLTIRIVFGSVFGLLLFLLLFGQVAKGVTERGSSHVVASALPLHTAGLATVPPHKCDIPRQLFASAASWCHHTVSPVAMHIMICRYTRSAYPLFKRVRVLCYCYFSAL